MTNSYIVYDWSVETEPPALKRVLQVGNHFLDKWNEASKSGAIGREVFTLLYVPIVMGSENAPRYPARSSLDVSGKTINCSPQLDFVKFVSAGFVESCEEFLRGLDESVMFLQSKPNWPSEWSDDVAWLTATLKR